MVICGRRSDCKIITFIPVPFSIYKFGITIPVVMLELKQIGENLICFLVCEISNEKRERITSSNGIGVPRVLSFSLQ